MPGSIAAREMDAQHAYAAEPPWGSQPAGEAHTMAHVRIVMCEDYLRSLQRLLKSPASQFAPFPVARAAIETSARAWWLLEGDDLELRVIRGLTERLHALYDESRFESAELKIYALERLDGLGAIAERFGWRIVRSDRRPPYFEHHQQPSATQLAQELVGPNNLGANMYRYFSAVAHSNAAGLFTGRAEAAQAVDGAKSFSTRLTPQTAVVVVAGTLRGFTRVFERWITFNGWDVAPWKQLYTHADRELLDVMKAVEAAIEEQGT